MITAYMMTINNNLTVSASRKKLNDKQLRSVFGLITHDK